MGTYMNDYVILSNTKTVHNDLRERRDYTDYNLLLQSSGNTH